MVIAADRPPSDLESLDDRVRSRLAGGLVVEMGSLGEELRRLPGCATDAHHLAGRQLVGEGAGERKAKGRNKKGVL